MTYTQRWSLLGLLLTTLTSVANAANWDHVHILVPDTKAAAEWYAANFDGKVTKSGPFDAVLFGDDLVKFREATPETKGSAGSSIDHIAFAVPDVVIKLGSLVNAGAKVTMEPFEIRTVPTIAALIEDPWGTSIEILVDKSVSGFHHVHLLSPDPETAIAWYARIFGGDATLLFGLPGQHAIRYEDMWLVIRKGEAPTPSTGHTIDHLGWNMPDFDELVAKLKGEGVEFALEPRPAENPTMAYILGPDGAKIEIVRAGAH